MKLYLYLYGSLDIATDPGVNRDISSSQCSAIFSLKKPGFYPMFLLKKLAILCSEVYCCILESVKAIYTKYKILTSIVFLIYELSKFVSILRRR